MPPITRRLLSLAVALSASLAAQQPPTPKTMTKIEVILQSPDAPAGSFAAKPRVMYFAGTTYGRVEEAFDSDRNLHGLVVIHEPDFWMINLADNTGQHAIDPGPTFNIHIPIFPYRVHELPDGQKKKLQDLEFTHELEYFKAAGATPQKGPVLQTKETTLYNVKIGDASVSLFTYGTPERPLSVVWLCGDEHDILWYSGYGEMPFDLKLFSKPENVKIVDAKPQ